MRRKKRSATRRPPLSLLDKFIYGLLIAASCFVFLCLTFFWEDLRNTIAFRDPSVVAYAGHASALLFLFLAGYLVVSGIVFFSVLLTYKKPIFGNSKIKYGQYPWDKDCYPLFDHGRRHVTGKASRKRFHRHMLVAWGIGLLLAAFLSVFSFCGRDCLCRDNSIVSYNMVNRQTGSPYSEKDYSRLTLYIKRVGTYRTASLWRYGITIEMNDGKRFSFSNRDFHWREERYRDNCLEKMLEIKALFPPEAISISGEKNIDKAAAHLGLNDEQTQLLHELFSS